MKGILKFLSNMLLLAVVIGFIYYFIKLLFHPKYWWIGWLWIVISIICFCSYESNWPK
jgi:hypothetical protein